MNKRKGSLIRRHLREIREGPSHETQFTKEVRVGRGRMTKQKNQRTKWERKRKGCSFHISRRGETPKSNRYWDTKKRWK